MKQMVAAAEEMRKPTMNEKRLKSGKFKRALNMGAPVLIGLAGLFIILFSVPISGLTRAAVLFLVGYVLLWVTIVILGFAGPAGRVESQRILERPFDERERTIRGRALGTAFASMMVVCMGWLVLAIIDHKSVAEPLLLLLFGLASVTASIDLFRRRG